MFFPEMDVQKVNQDDMIPDLATQYCTTLLRPRLTSHLGLKGSEDSNLMRQVHLFQPGCEGLQL